MNLIYNKWGHLLTSIEQPWLSPANLLKFPQVIHEKGGTLRNCWDSLMVLFGQCLVLEKAEGYFTVDIRKFIPPNFNQLQHQKGLLQICMDL